MLYLNKMRYMFFNFVRLSLLFVLCLGILIFGSSLTAEAVLQLNVTPSQGGSALNFGRIDSALAFEKDIRLRVTSTNGERYQVFQRVIDPFVNERGQQLDLDVMKTYFQSGSNSFGTAYLQTVSSMTYSDQLVYSSGQDGGSDSFRIVYLIDKEKLVSDGSFLGRVLYTIRSLESGEQEQIFLNIRFESSQQLKVNVSGGKSVHEVTLNDRDEFHRMDSVEIEYSGLMGGDELRVSQEVVVFPQNKLFEEINEGSIRFSTTTENSDGEALVAESLPRKPVQIFSSKEREGEIIVTFELDVGEETQLQSGEFNGRLKYYVDAGFENEEYDLDFKVVIEPLFQLDVDLPLGGVRFDHVLPNEPPQISEVAAEVKTNLKKPYVVTQRILSPMTNEKGEEIDSQYFQMKVEFDSNVRGESPYEQFKPVPMGDAPIVLSSRKGDSVKFRVFYRLSSYAKMAPGKYSTSIVYSLGER